MSRLDNRPKGASLILLTATRYLVPVLFLFAFFVLIRGHNEPGGGFVGGLIAASAFALYAIARSLDEARRLLRVSTETLIGVGLLIAFGSGLVGVLYGRPFLTGIWNQIPLPVVGKIGTPGIFDVGVFLTVLGVALQIVFGLMEED
mgnify:CR=1 FL=1